MFITTGIERKEKEFTSLHCWQELLFIWSLPQKPPGGLWRTFCEGEDGTAQCLALSVFLLPSALVLRQEFKGSPLISSPMIDARLIQP